MRTLPLALAALAVSTGLGVGAARAQNLAYCLVTGPGPGNCMYATYRQCMASASGTGYICQRNYALRSSRSYARSRARYYGPQY